MGRFSEFMRKERLYVLLLIFVLFVTAIIMMPVEERAKGHPSTSIDRARDKSLGTRGPRVKPAEKRDLESLDLKRGEVEKVLSENKHLAFLLGLVSLLVLFVLGLGLAVDIILVSSVLKNRLDISTYAPRPIMWGVWDVCKVTVLFVFFGYILIMIESALIRVFPLVKNSNFRMVLNSSILDTLGVVFILYFTVGRYREKLISLGITLKNFFRNIFYGMVGYIAIVPVLIAVLLVITYVADLIKYVPEKQPVVELFLKEKSAPLLVYASLFAAIVGPVIEELFFRAFMYNAVKKYIGIFWATLITSALFAALHAHAVGFLPIMVLGVLLAYLYEKTGTLVSSITVHMMHNLSMVGLVFLVKQLGIA